MGTQNRHNAEGHARPRAAWIVVAGAVLLLAMGAAWWMASPHPNHLPLGEESFEDRARRAQANGPALSLSNGPHQATALTPAEQEQALRADQLRTAKELVAAFPGSDDAVYLLGLVHHEQGNTEAAIKLWQRSLELDASRADANDSLGHVLLLRDEYQGAEEHFRKALVIDPTLATANGRLASALIHQGKMREAAAILEKAQSLNAEGHRLLGETYQHLEEFQKAKASYTKAIALNADLTEAHYGLSRVLNRLGEQEPANHYFQTFSALRARAEQRGRVGRANYDTMTITKQSVAQTL